MSHKEITINKNGVEHKAAEVTDARGRKIVVRKMSALDRFRFTKLIPSGIGDVQFWLSQALVAASVVSIDGVTFPAPTTETMVEKIIETLDDDGIEAIQGPVIALLNPKMTAEEIDAAKNLQGTPSSKS